MRPPYVLVCLFLSMLIFTYLTAFYLHTIGAGWLFHFMGLTNNATDWRVASSALAVCWFGASGMYVLITMLRYGTIVEGFIGRYVGGHQHGALSELLSTLIQMGRFLFYVDDIYLLFYICLTFLMLITFLDLFAQRPDTTIIARKVAKRCFYGAMILLYQGQRFNMNLYLFKLPTPNALIPLVTAAFAGYITVFCSDDLPQHVLVPNWFGWRISSPFVVHVE